MKRKLSLVILVLAGGLMAVCAGEVDPCVEKHTTCMNSCENAQAQCKARGTVPEQCENNYRHCKAACEKAKADCDAKKSTPKKPAPKKN